MIDRSSRGSAGDGRALLLTYLRPHGFRVLLLAALMFVGTALQLLNPQIVRGFIDAAQAGAGSDQLLRAGLLFAGIALLIQLASLAETYLAEDLGWLATNALRSDLVRRCLERELTFHDRRRPGELIERVDGDVGALANFFTRFALQLVGSLALLVGVLVVLFRIDPRVGGVLLLFSALNLFLVGRARAATTGYSVATRAAKADLFGFVEERLAGLADLQACGAGAYTLARATPVLLEVVRRRRDELRRATSLWSAIGLTFGLGTIAALGFGVALYRGGEITLGTVYLIFQYALMLRQPLDQISRQTEDFQQAAASIERIREIAAGGEAGNATSHHPPLPPRAFPQTGHSEPATPQSPAEPVTVESPARRFLAAARNDRSRSEHSTVQETASSPRPGATRGGPLAVELERVSFEYLAGAPVLRDVSFGIGPGRSLGVVGRTGSGKTTIARLILGLYAPDGGRVLLGGVDLREWPAAELRARVGVVTQEVQLFRATVRDNLTLFDPTIPDDRLLRAIEAAELGDWFAGLAAGLESELVSGGPGLSAGEAQLLAFARVFLREPDLVILDEASSRLDPATERQLDGAIDRLLRGRTALIVAHRLATMRHVDDILVLEEGRGVEMGPREVLAADPTSRFGRLLRSGPVEVPA